MKGGIRGIEINGGDRGIGSDGRNGKGIFVL